MVKIVCGDILVAVPRAGRTTVQSSPTRRHHTTSPIAATADVASIQGVHGENITDRFGGVLRDFFFYLLVIETWNQSIAHGNSVAFRLNNR